MRRMNNENYNGDIGDDDDLRLDTLNTDRDFVSMDILRTMHSQQIMDRHVSNARYTRELVEILGGIDMILKDYLNPNTDELVAELTELQIREIYNLIKPKFQKDLTLDAMERDRTDLEDLKIYYFFDADNTFLHSIVNHELADAVIRLFWSIPMKVLLCCMIIAYFTILVLTESSDSPPIWYQTVNISISFIIFVPYAIVYMLALNKEAFKMSLKTFEFWLKTVYGCIYIVSSAIDELYLNPENYTDYGIKIEVAIVEYTAFSVWLMLTIICVASLDAIKLNRIWKVIILGVCSCVGLVWTGTLALVATADENRRDSSVLVINNSFAISMLTLEISDREWLLYLL